MSIPDGYGIYATADIAALVEAFEAQQAVERGVLDFTLHAEAVARLADAWAAITPELLARVTATTDATPPASGVRVEGTSCDDR